MSVCVCVCVYYGEKNAKMKRKKEQREKTKKSVWAKAKAGLLCALFHQPSANVYELFDLMSDDVCPVCRCLCVCVCVCVCVFVYVCGQRRGQDHRVRDPPAHFRAI